MAGVNGAAEAPDGPSSRNRPKATRVDPEAQGRAAAPRGPPPADVRRACQDAAQTAVLVFFFFSTHTHNSQVHAPFRKLMVRGKVSEPLPR